MFTPTQIKTFERIRELREIKVQESGIIDGGHTWEERFDAKRRYQAARREQKKIHEGMNLKTYVLWSEWQAQNPR